MIAITPEQYKQLQSLINYALEHMPENQLTDEMLKTATVYNSMQITCADLD